MRKLQIVKLRGQASVPGLHTFRITHDGLQAFSRTLGLGGQTKENTQHAAPFHRYSANWIRCSGEGFLKAIVSWWQGLRGRENRSWQPNSLPRAYAGDTGNCGGL